MRIFGEMRYRAAPHADFPHFFTPTVDKIDASLERGMRWAFHVSWAFVFAVLWLMVIGSFALPAEPPIVIGHSFADLHGGEVEEFAARYAAIRATGQKVVIDGPCVSACTIVASLPHGEVCVTPRAMLGVHLAVDADHRPDLAYTAWAVANWYPLALQDWIARHGGLAEEPKWVGYRDLLAIFQSCAADDGGRTTQDGSRRGR